jgi:hypothetical protein
MSQMLYFILQTPDLRDLQLARICLPIECASSPQSYVPSSPLVQVSAMEARMNDILRKLQVCIHSPTECAIASRTHMSVIL